MTFHCYPNTGGKFGPYGSMPLARKWAIALLAMNRKTKVVEVRPVCSPFLGEYGKGHRSSGYLIR